jgi:type I restriction enzyme M protein
MPRGGSKKSANDHGAGKPAPAKGNGNGANLGFEAQLFLAADKLRKNLEPSDYKHVCLGLIFLKRYPPLGGLGHRRLVVEDLVERTEWE